MPVPEPDLESLKIPVSRIKQIQDNLIRWGETNYADFSWRSTNNPRHALIAELMLQRTKAEQVEPVYNSFTSKYSSYKEASKNTAELLEIFTPLGLNWRNQKLVELIKVLTEQEVPNNKEELMVLPGVGHYIANAYLSLHCDKKAPVIDSNAVRLWSRVLGFTPPKETHKKKWFHKLVDEITPEEHFKEFNYAVLDLTRSICKPKPVCSRCPLNNDCKYFSVVNKS